MISRTTALFIAEAYNACFTGITYYGRTGQSSHYLSREELYDLLYIANFEAWFLNLINKISSVSGRGLKDFIMKLHTGESINQSTPNFTWKQKIDLGQKILKDLAECLISSKKLDPKFEKYEKSKLDSIDNMQKSLELDGYIYRDGALFIPEEAIIEEKEEEGLLESIIKELKLKDIKTIVHHLKLSAEHYQNSLWDDSISNSRKVLESVLQQTAIRYDEGKNILNLNQVNRPVEIRDYLEREGLLYKIEKETIAKVYGLLSNTGGHPYIAEKDQARLMRHLALTFSQFVLLRLEGALKIKP